MGCVCDHEKVLSEDENEVLRSILPQICNQEKTSIEENKEEEIDFHIQEKTFLETEKLQDKNEVSFEYIDTFDNNIKNSFIMSKTKEDTLFLQSNIIYTGSLIEGIPNGKGKLILGKNKFYKGDFYNSSFEGFGKYKEDGYDYEGHWKSNKREGKGVETIEKCKQVYNGTFLDDLKEGDGVLSINGLEIFGKFSKGNILRGTWYNNEKTFEGKWKNAKLYRLTVKEPNKTKLKLRFKKSGKVQVKFPDGKTSLLQSMPKAKKFIVKNQ